jgi:NADPH:quinone reductase-like Zn-dependent oxidoreductase
MEWRDISEPQIVQSSQAIVEVAATALNRGELAWIRRQTEGAVLGSDLAGVVREAAPDGSGPGVGTRVFGWTEHRGSWAERVAVETSTIAPIPPAVSFAEATAAGVAALTALYALRRGGNLMGRLVLITGAAGGVGRNAVQMAVASGARVLAIVGTHPSRVDAIESLGLNGIAIAHQLEPEGERANVILESVGGESLSAAFRRVARGGLIVTYGRSSLEPGVVPPEWFHRGARLEGLEFALEHRNDPIRPSGLVVIGDLLAARRLDPGLGWESDWASLPQAAKALMDRTVAGRAVLRIGGDGARED